MKKKSDFGIVGLFCISGLFINSCVKYKQPQLTEYSSAQISLQVKVDSDNLEWDTVKFVNVAGNKYGVHNINMYISNIKMKTITGEIYFSKKIFYLDPLDIKKNKLILDSIPVGIYDEISFYIGVDSVQNKSFLLPTSIDNLNMAWPDAMGGGYHFLKLEGYYLDNLSVKKGFAIHLGKNSNIPFIKISQIMKQENVNQEYTLFFDVNEVFKNPYQYNFNIDNNYTMTDSLAMLRIKQNITDAFKIVKNM